MTQILDNKTLDAMTWVDEFGDFLFRYAMARVPNASTAEDLVQETLLSGLQAVDKFEGMSSVRTWLTGILKNKIVDHYRRTRLMVEIGDDDDMFDEILHWRADAEPQVWNVRNPEGDLECKELGSVIRDALTAIPKPLSTIFALREIEGLCRKEICEILGITDANYWVMLHRARFRLRREVELRWQRDDTLVTESFEEVFQAA